MAQKNKHIVILTPGFPENESDTACIPALHIYVKALKEISGCDITIVALHYPEKKAVYQWNEATVYALGSSSGMLKILLWQRTYKTLMQIHLQKRITALHSFWLGECAFIGHWFSKKNKIRHLTTLMGQDALKGNKYTKLLPLRKMQLITLSDFHQRVFDTNYGIRTEIIPWGINPRNFNPPTEKHIDIIGVGSLIPLKNHDLFIEVIHQINQLKSTKAVLIGDGILKEKLQEKIRLLHLENTIELKGKLDYEETLKYISQSKILLHTSKYESFGLVFAEALQSKTMIVSDDVGSAFPSQNWSIASTETGMVTACKNLLSKCFSEEINPFTIEKTVQHYLSIYDK